MIKHLCTLLAYKVMPVVLVMLFGLGTISALAVSQTPGQAAGRFFDADGQPLQYSAVLFFSTNLGPVSMPQGYDWYPDAVAPIINDGRFEVKLPPGKYWYGVIKIPEAAKRSHAHNVEWLYISEDKNGIVHRLEVQSGKTSNMGDIKIPADIFTGRTPSPISVISGRLLDQFKKPVAGFVIEAFSKNEDDALPVFVSGLTDANGVYSIRLTAGVFFIKVRPPGRFTLKGQLNKDFNRYIMPLARRVAVGKNKDIPGINITMRLK